MLPGAFAPFRRARAVPLTVSFGLLSASFAAGYGAMFAALDDFHDAYGIGKGALGGVVAAGFFAAFLAQITLAPLADRGHARRLVYLGMAINVGGLVVMAYGTTLGVLTAARFAMGIGTGMAIPAIRRIVIVAEPERLGHNLGLLLSADVAGFALGPAFAAVLIGPFGIPAPFLVIAAINLACSPLVGRITVGETERGAGAEPSRFAFDLLRSKPYAAAVALGLGVFFMIATFDALWSLVLDDLHASNLVSSLGITLFAVPLVIFGSTGGRLAQRFGPFRVGALGLAVGAVFMFFYGLMPTGQTMLAVGIAHSFSDGLTVSSSGVAVGMVTPEERQAGGQGLIGGMQTLAGGVTAVVIGQVYERSGRTWAYAGCAAAMLACVLAARVLAGDTWRLRQAVPVEAPVIIG